MNDYIYENIEFKNKIMGDKEKPKKPTVTSRPNTTSTWQTFNKSEKKDKTEKKKGNQSN